MLFFQKCHLVYKLAYSIFTLKGGTNVLNQIIIVGRLVKDPFIRETDSGIKVSNITLAVDRNFKNSNGEYETDFLDCILWKGIAASTAEYCRQGDLIGVKGRLQSRVYVNDNGDKKYTKEVVAEKVTFLNTKNHVQESEDC